MDDNRRRCILYTFTLYKPIITPLYVYIIPPCIMLWRASSSSCVTSCCQNHSHPLSIHLFFSFFPISLFSMKRWIEAFKRLCGFGRPDCFAIIILMAMIACYGTMSKSIINTPWFLSFIKRAMHHVISNPKVPSPSSAAIVGANSKRKPRKRVFIKSKQCFTSFVVRLYTFFSQGYSLQL